MKVNVLDERILNKTLQLVSLPLSNFDTMQEQKLFNLLIFLAQKSLDKQLLRDKDFSGEQRKIYIRYSDIKEFLRGNTNYLKTEEIDKLLQKFSKTNIETKTIEIFKDKKRIYERTSNRITTFFQYVESVNVKIEELDTQKKYRKDCAVFCFNQSILEDFIMIDPMNSNYIKTLMSVTTMSKSIYTPKIIEMLSRYLHFNTSKTNQPYTIKLEDFKKIMGISTHKTFKEFKFINLKILKKVQKEAEEKFNFKFSYDLIKEKRNVIGIKFYMTNQAKNEYKDFLNRFEYLSRKSDILEKKALSPSSIPLQKEQDKILCYTQKMHMLDGIALLKKELLGVSGFEKYYKDIIPGNKYGDFVFIGKNKSIKNQYINYSIADSFVFKLKTKGERIAHAR